MHLTGFKRRALRTHNNRNYMIVSRKVPPMFWDEVDRISLQILSMLLPLYNVAVEAHPAQLMPFDTVYEKIHDLVAYAGWVNVALQTSDSIVSFDWEKPGDPYTIHQVNLHHGVFEYSKVRTEQQLQKAGHTADDHTARVKISVVPQITHFIPGKNGLVEGRASVRLMRSHVVYYQGLVDEREDYESHPSLADYIRQEKGAQKRSQQMTFLLVLCFIMYYLYASQNDTILAFTQKASQYIRM
jgi:hypothetical protein